MPKELIWSPDSERDLDTILAHLSSGWNPSVSTRFLDLIEKVLVQISINPRQFPVIQQKFKIRKCVLTKHNTLYYRNKRNHVELLRIYNNRQDPLNLKFN